ncbi:hypothetical protein ACIPCF_08120 [Paracoccus marcusii]|uniref:hypothetical protein n=1 Tax=Paracoccus marcusii TaxID=59779 RepID=UPI0038BB475E
MADRPILFSGPMIRALLEGKKTQTRRVIEPCEPAPLVWRGDKPAPNCIMVKVPARHGGFMAGPTFNPRYATGDRLWVRERFAISGIGWGKKPSEARGGKVHHHADPEHGWHDYWGSWRPSIHMPRWASRLTLIVTDVRVQRLQDISEADAQAEGIERMKTGRGYYDPTVSKAMVRAGVWHSKASQAFEALWDSLNADRAPWASNPWVCAVSFTVQHCNIDRQGVPPAKPAILEGVS